jgi:hypothetical protein
MIAVLSRLAGSARPDALHLPLQGSARPLIDPEDRIQAQAILGDYIEDLPDARFRRDELVHLVSPLGRDHPSDYRRSVA